MQTMPRLQTSASPTIAVLGVLVLALTICMACGEDEAGSVQVVKGAGDQVDYGTESDVVVVNGEEWILTGDPGQACVQVGDVCVDYSDAKNQCKDEGSQLDVIVVGDEVVEVLCYPPPSAGTQVEEATVNVDGTATLPQNQSGAVVTFGDETNGVPFVGDIRLDAEQTIFYGNGVDETTVDGNISIASNKSQIRGMTVTGNVTVEKNSNNTSATFCRIQGNLLVEGNSFVGANCQVFGNVSVNGSGAILANIGVGGQFDVNDATFCDGCYSFADANNDFVVADGEIGDDLACSGTAP